MAKFIVLRGNSGNGKTTVARALQRRFGHGTMLISQDTVRREMIYVRDGPGNKAVDLLRELVLFSRKQCDIAILEGIIYGKSFPSIFFPLIPHSMEVTNDWY